MPYKDWGRFPTQGVDIDRRYAGHEDASMRPWPDFHALTLPVSPSTSCSAATTGYPVFMMMTIVNRMIPNGAPACGHALHLLDARLCTDVEPCAFVGDAGLRRSRLAHDADTWPFVCQRLQRASPPYPGTLWEGRYKSCLVGGERYVLACHRYIELNPVRAAMVAHPGEFPWSSHGANAAGKPDPLLRSPSRLSRPRQFRWSASRRIPGSLR